MRLKFKNAQKSFDKALKKKKRMYHKGQLLLIERCNVNNPKAFWEQINKLGPKKVGSIPWEVKIDGVSYCDCETVLDKWKSDFAGLYQSSGTGFNDEFQTNLMEQSLHTQRSADDHSSSLNKLITYDEVERTVKDSKLKKACGMDKVTNELLKKDEVVELLHCLFVKCQKTQLIPDIWRLSVINPIPKSDGFVSDPLKYRGLSLQSCIYKIFNSILNKRVMGFLESNEILEEEQNGFRSRRSCLQHIFVLQTLIRNKCLKDNLNLFGCFVDYTKAFDSINRGMLLRVLQNYGVTGPILGLLSEMYKNTVNTVRVNGQLTGAFESTLGSKQGDPGSPGHFNVYINGLLRELKSSGIGIELNDGGNPICVLAYADDIVLLAESEEDLQKLMNIVSEWYRKWRLTVNPSKSAVMHFRRPHVPVTVSVCTWQH